MVQFDPIVFRELPVIQKIIWDERWLEGQRPGCAVGSDDPIVRENVCLVILRIGAQLRESLAAEIPPGPLPTMAAHRMRALRSRPAGA